MIKPKCEKGQILIISFIIMSALIVIVSAFIFMISARARSFANQATDVKSFWLAEAGIEDKMLELMNEDTSNISATEFVDGQYEVDVHCDDPINYPDIYRLTSTGWISYPDQRKIEVSLEVSYQFSNPRGFCANQDIDISGDGGIDSYDSSVGRYEDQTPGGVAQIGGNSDIDLIGNAKVSGDIESGGDFTITGMSAEVTGDVTSGGAVSGESLITGDINENVYPPPQPFDDAIIAQIEDEVNFYSNPLNNDNNNEYLISEGFLNGTEFSLKANEECYMPPGDYYFTEFDISGNAELFITGEVRIYYDGPDISLAGRGISNSSDNAANFSLISKSDDEILITGTAAFAGLIFAPESTLIYRGNENFYGGAVAHQIEIIGNGAVHCDVNITAGPATQHPTGINVMSWDDQS